MSDVVVNFEFQAVNVATRVLGIGEKWSEQYRWAFGVGKDGRAKKLTPEAILARKALCASSFLKDNRLSLVGSNLMPSYQLERL